MKNKHFVFILMGIIILMIMAFTFQMLFDEQTTNFGLSCGIFFLSIFCLVCYKNALKPSENFGPINRTKRHYESKGQLPQYQNLCKILFIITIALGILALIGGTGEVFINHLKPIFKI